VGETTAAPKLQRVGQRASRFAHWDRVNWRLSNRDLAAVWQLKPKTVDMMRFRKKHGRAQSCNAEGYREELEAEKLKAKALA
jgi:hypothetical protein